MVPEGLIIIDAVGRAQGFDAADVPDPLLHQSLALAMQPPGGLLLGIRNLNHTALASSNAFWQAGPEEGTSRRA
jgi:hypothetical protein